MPVSLYPPLAFTRIGGRTTNQDRLWPQEGQISPDSRLFVVCDGMGGTDRGDVASQLLVQTIEQYMASCNNPLLDSVHLLSVLDLAYEAYEQFLDQHPLVSRLGSTLALVQFHDRGATIAHIGDSRVYWVRNGQILFQTADHKRVNDLVEAGILTPNQARHHPWRNRLSRAVLLRRDETGTTTRRPSGSEANPNVEQIDDVQAGDYFFICTDGVLEKIDDKILTSVLRTSLPDAIKLEMLLGLCEGQTSDNYSGYLVRVEAVAQPDLLNVPNRFGYS